MPELPEVEIIMRGLRPHLEGRRIRDLIQRRGDLRRPFPENFRARVCNRSINKLTRRAKYIIGELEGGEKLLIHLGMSGRFNLTKVHTERDVSYGLHDHLVFILEEGQSLIYTDPRRFGVVDLFATTHPLLVHLGVEPLEENLSVDYLIHAFQSKKAPIKTALLDQRIIAGLGNIYVCEILYRIGLSPLCPAGRLANNKILIERLINETRIVLQEAIQAGGSTLRDFSHSDGSLGSFQQHFLVYNRAGQTCFSCGHSISRLMQAGRSSFCCQRCQKILA